MRDICVAISRPEPFASFAFEDEAPFLFVALLEGLSSLGVSSSLLPTLTYIRFGRPPTSQLRRPSANSLWIKLRCTAGYFKV